MSGIQMRRRAGGGGGTAGSGGSSTGLAPTAMPVGDWFDTTTSTTWKQIYSEDFNVTVPGANVDLATGVTNWRTAGSMTLPAGNPYTGKFGCYEKTIPDTYNQALNYAERTMWTENGSLVINCHADTIPEKNSGTTAYPLCGTFNPYTTHYYKDYVRVVFRYRTVTNIAAGTLSRYGGVWQLINSNNWPAYGEYDFPEADANGNVQGFQHYANTAGGQQVVTVASPSVPIKDNWVIAEQKWEPGAGSGHLVWKVNDRTALDTTTQVNPPGSTGVKSFNFQCGTHNSGNPPALTTTARFEIDWCVIYAHPASNSYTDTPNLTL